MSEPLFDDEFLKKLEYLNLIAKRLVFGRQQALRSSVKKGASTEFREFRSYVHGDEPRAIDWTVYARLGEVVVKLFRQEEELDLYLLLDRSRSMDFGEPNKFRLARQIAAALGYIGLCNMDSASVMPFADSLESGLAHLRGRGRVFGLLEFLQELISASTTDLVKAAREFVARVRRPGLVVLISDFYGLQSAERALDQLRFYKHQVYVIQLASPWELDPPIRGELRLVDVESSAHRDLVISPSMLKKYRKAFAQFHEELRQYSMKYSIGYAQSSTERPFDEFIRGVLEKGGLVA